jgi:hypothetical protein
MRFIHIHLLRSRIKKTSCPHCYTYYNLHVVFNALFDMVVFILCVVYTKHL